MATKKKKKKKQSKSKKPVRKVAKAKVKIKAKAKKSVKKAAARKAPPKKRRIRGESGRAATIAFERETLTPRSGGQSGDLQGLSSAAGADSESVDELIEEGNSFEAEIVKGVQDASDADEGEVVTHEVPEDDVPDEYKDQ